MLYLFATLFISATLARGRGKGRGKGGKGKGGGSCTVTVEEQNNYLDTFLAPFTTEGSDDSTTCHMRMMSSSWPHEDAVGATRRLLFGTEVAFDVTGKAVSALLVNDACVTTTSLTVSSVEFNYAVEVEESMAEEDVAEDEVTEEDSSDCDKDSDSEEATEDATEEEAAEDATEEEATEGTTEGDATEENDDLIPIRRNLGDSEESNRAYAVLTLTQTNSNEVSFDLTVQCGVVYRTDEGTCTAVALNCEDGDYSYNVEVEGAEPESVESHFGMSCMSNDSSAICQAA